MSATTTRPRRAVRTKTRPRSPESTLPTSLWQPRAPFHGLTFTDIFCGAGGSSLGLTHAGFKLDLGANHWQRAIDTHSANFTYAEHLCADIDHYDMRKLRPSDVLWASPICTELSPAGGGKHGKGGRTRSGHVSDGQYDLLEEYGPIDQAAYDKTRATFWDIIRATEVWRYKAVMVENVPDAAEKWVLFPRWVDCMETLGYNVQLVSVNTAHVGGPDNPWAPQWRDRMYVVCTRKGFPLPDVALRPIAHCDSCGETVRGVQTWCPAARNRVFRVGRYRRDPNSSYGQYWYACPNTRCAGVRVEPYVKPAAAAIDWSNVGELIADRRKPLTGNTVARIKAGLKMYYRPFVATARTSSNPVTADVAEPLRAVTTGNNHALVSPSFTVNSNHDDDRIHRVDSAPLAAATTKIGTGVVNPPMMVPCGGTWADEVINALTHPARTTLANEKGCESLVIPGSFLTVLRNHNAPVDVQSDAADTIAAGGNHHYLTIPPGAFYTMNYSGEAGREPTRMARPVREPLGAQTATNSHGVVVPPDPAAFLVQNYGNNEPHNLAKHPSDPFGPITTKDHHALVVPYYTKGDARSSSDPFDAMTTRDRFALVQTLGGWSDADLDELVRQCHYRMLMPREALNAQRFDADYLVTGNIGEQTMQAGNAVSCNVAQWIGERVYAALNATVAS